MNSYLISASLSNGPPAGVHASVRTDTYNNGTSDREVWDALNENLPTLGDSYLLASWDAATGALLSEIHPDFYQIRPLGNYQSMPVYDDDGNQIGESKAGGATDHLRYHYWATPGLQDRELGDGRRYPEDNSPFAIETRAKEFFGTWAGWGWRSEIIGGADSRDPSVRAIGIYSDPECKDYLYTTGAFVQGDSDWQTDENGDPLQVWHSETPAGRATNPQVETHFAVLWASIQEGYDTLPADEAARVQHLYWKETQQSAQTSRAVWSDSGFTVLAQYGTVYKVSPLILAALNANEPLRFGDHEVTVIAARPGYTDQLLVDHVVNNVTGSAIYWRR